jgi:chromosome segregation ATPase
MGSLSHAGTKLSAYAVDILCKNAVSQIGICDAHWHTARLTCITFQEMYPMAAATVSVDEFQALEQKVLQTVELIKMERASRAAFEAEALAARAEVAAAEARVAEAHAKVDELTARVSDKESQIAKLQQQISAAGSASQQELEGLQREREAVKHRVEKMLANLDELL